MKWIFASSAKKQKAVDAYKFLDSYRNGNYGQRVREQKTIFENTKRINGIDAWKEFSEHDALPISTPISALASGVIPTCLTALQVGKVMAGIYPNWDAAAYADYCKRFELPENKKYGDYSTGMKMKQCLAVALSHHPKLLLLDEATSGLDPVVRDELIDLLLDFVRDENNAILISSHIVSDLEKLCDTIAFLQKGKLLLCEDKDTLREEYALWHGTAGQLEELDKNAIVSRRVTAYGAEALVKRELVPAGSTLTPVSIEELFVLMVKGENVR